jgi:hypothetical protein
MSVTGPILTELMNPQQRFVKNIYSDFHENPTKGWFADIRSQTYGRVLRKRRFIS